MRKFGTFLAVAAVVGAVVFGMGGAVASAESSVAMSDCSTCGGYGIIQR